MAAQSKTGPMLPRFREPSICRAHRVLPLLMTVVLLFTGCQRDAAAPSPAARSVVNDAAAANTKVLKVYVTVSGEITADGQPVTPDQLAAKLAELKQAGGEVWYCRENPSAEPHPNAMKVMELVADNQLSIRLSSKPDFSDFVDDQGVSRPGGPSRP